ncbi:ribosome silencing factor [Dialister pneumosintes]|uniref:Ribosomal silencing factor RsfS n=1 Tax=Dialister pneumosintes TaxID=39950 RepID=A0A1B3WDA7_9FIRM|nr:ribosome silencing factor [Dialister pneumosintes]AOH38932.1 ribosome silencing factor [Dialister pneumosintes]MBS6479920.1 ribosome silencing factor [Dialister sp.]RID94104.1 ribosome silencing factor [Dialister pneumosintes]CDF27691.1 iojap-like protein [Dialister sp. CAG:588]
MNQEVKMICQAISSKKGVLIKVLDVKDLTSVADYFILSSTRNKKQAQAAADAVEEKMKENNIRCLRKEGYREGDWILMDFSDVIVHIFTDDERRHYELDSLWGDAPVEEYHDDVEIISEGILQVKK